MSGVIDANGVQWEHCTVCGSMERLTNLGYERPSAAFPHGRDICMACTNAHSDIESIDPAADWQLAEDDQDHIDISDERFGPTIAEYADSPWVEGRKIP